MSWFSTRTPSARMALGIVAVSTATGAATAPITGHAASTPSCSLSSLVLGGVPVVSASAVNLKHNAAFEIAWSEPSITQTQYVSSTSWGSAGQTVLNDQGSGTYTAAFWSVDKAAHPVALLTTCSISV